MKRFTNILVSVDSRADSHPALDWAVALAERSSAAIKIADVLPEFSWAVRLTMSDSAHVRDLLLREKGEQLESLAAPLRQRGLTVATNARCGQTSVELIREVLEGNHDLLIRAAKGKDSRREGFFGTTTLRLLRKCPCPVWAVEPESTPSFTHVLATVECRPSDELHSQLDDELLDLARSIAGHLNAKLSVLHAWNLFGENILRSRMSREEVKAVEADARAAVERVFDEVLQRHKVTLRDDNAYLIKGDPAAVIPRFVAEHSVDLIVMGTVGRSGLSGLLMGNTAELILSRVNCAVVALKPPGFVSPVKLA